MHLAKEASDEIFCGLTFQRSGRLAEAVACLRRAAIMAPDSIEAHGYLAALLSSMGAHEESAAEYQEVLRLRPDFPEALCNLGNEWLSLGRPADAEEALRKGVGIRPEFPEGLNSLGVALKGLGRLEEALDAFRRAVAQRPQYIEAECNLGNTLLALDCPMEAVNAYLRVLNSDPRHADAWGSLGGALLEIGQIAEAEDACLRALALVPDHVVAFCNLGNTCLARNQEEDAIAFYRRALAKQPGHSAALCGIGNALLQLNRVEDALAEFRAGSAASPRMADLRFNESLACLLLGDLERGFRLFEHRLETKSAGLRRRFSVPRLLPGVAVSDRTVLIYPEQGLGDTIQFMRYALVLQGAGARVILEVQAPLLSLMATCYPDLDVRLKGSVEVGFDLHCPIMSLPFVCGTAEDSIPFSGGYLRAPSEKIEAWRSRISDDPGPRIGVVWAGNPKHKNDKRRSMPMDTMRALVSGFVGTVYSLQKGGAECLEERTRLWPGLRDFTAELVDFADTAALIETLDLVITVDTAVAHLSGALGRQTWVLLPFAPDWRWQLDRRDSPWYANLTLFRQNRPNEWRDVATEVGNALRRLAAV